MAHLLTPFPPVKTAAPQLVTVHDVMPFEHPEWYPPSERWIFRRTAKLVLRRARRIVVPSVYMADRLVALLDVDSARIETVPHGVSGTFASVQSEHDIAATCARFGVEPGRFAVCVGWVATRKNLIPLIRAMAELPGQRIPLLLVGPDGHGAETVDAEIARLDGTVRVLRTGFLSDAETAALVRGAAVLLHPSLGEGFGLVPLEAMAVRTPVIAARASSVPEVVGHAAILIDQPMEPKAWGDALMDVLGSTELRAELAAAGERWAATFSWERAAKAMLQIYDDVARD